MDKRVQVRHDGDGRTKEFGSLFPSSQSVRHGGDIGESERHPSGNGLRRVACEDGLVGVSHDAPEQQQLGLREVLHVIDVDTFEEYAADDSVACPSARQGRDAFVQIEHEVHFVEQRVVAKDLCVF